jgi:hypothetical protein
MSTTSMAISMEIAELVEQYRAADERSRHRWVDRILRLMLPHFRNWAPTLCRISGDVPGKHEKVANWYSYLNGISRYAALAYFNSSEVTAASGMVALQRKQRHIARVREDLRKKLGREPEPAEIIDSANEQMRARRSNPEKQGVLVELADLDNVLPVADIADHDRAVEDDDYVLSPIEGRELVAAIIDACYLRSDQLGKAADVWVGDLYGEPPALGTVTEIARTLHIRQDRAADLLADIRTVSQQVCEGEYGVALPV